MYQRRFGKLYILPETFQYHWDASSGGEWVDDPNPPERIKAYFNGLEFRIEQILPARIHAPQILIEVYDDLTTTQWRKA